MDEPPAGPPPRLPQGPPPPAQPPGPAYQPPPAPAPAYQPPPPSPAPTYQPPPPPAPAYQPPAPSAPPPDPPGGFQPPPGFIAGATPAAPAAKLGFWPWFKLSPWWQKVLVLIPLLLIPLGGLIGALFGALAIFGNQSVFRSRMSTGAKVAIGIGIDLAAWVIVLIIATIVYTATHPNG